MKRNDFFSKQHPEKPAKALFAAKKQGPFGATTPPVARPAALLVVRVPFPATEADYRSAIETAAGEGADSLMSAPSSATRSAAALSPPAPSARMS